MPDPINIWLDLPYYALAFLAGYLSGSIPFGLILTRWAGLGDIRKIGSGNIGATNVLRTGNKPMAVATLVLDFAKGLVPVLIAYAWYGPDIAVIVASGALIGHMAPIWLRFKGGKGVAVGGGIVFGLSWVVGLMIAATWVLVAAASRISSLASLTAAAATPLYFWILAQYQYAELTALLGILVWVSHRANIVRLWAGTEPRIGEKR